MVAGGIEFSNGAVGSIDATTTAYPGFPERIELAFEKGSAALIAETLDLYFTDGRRIHHAGEASKSGGADPMAFSNDAHKALIVDFLDAMMNEGNKIGGISYAANNAGPILCMLQAGADA